MNISSIFNTRTDSNRQQVFEALHTLAKNNKKLLLVYREGRRVDDDFIKKPLKVDNLLFERIQFSNEWQVFIDSPNTSPASLAFKFSDNQLVSVSAINGEISLAMPFTFVLRCWLNNISSTIGRVIFRCLPLAETKNSGKRVAKGRSQKNGAQNNRFDDV